VRYQKGSSNKTICRGAATGKKKGTRIRKKEYFLLGFLLGKVSCLQKTDQPSGLREAGEEGVSEMVLSSGQKTDSQQTKLPLSGFSNRGRSKKLTIKDSRVFSLLL